MANRAFLMSGDQIIRTVYVDELTVADRYGKSYACCGCCGTCLAPMDLHYGPEIQRFNVRENYNHKANCEYIANNNGRLVEVANLDRDGAAFDIDTFLKGLHLPNEAVPRNPGPRGRGGIDGGGNGGGGRVIRQGFRLPNSLRELFHVLSALDLDEEYGSLVVRGFLIDRRTIGWHKSNPGQGKKLFVGSLGGPGKVEIDQRSQNYLTDAYSRRGEAIVYRLNYPDNKVKRSVGNILFGGEGEIRDRVFIAIGDFAPIEGVDGAYDVFIQSAAHVYRES